MSKTKWMSVIMLFVLCAFGVTRAHADDEMKSGDIKFSGYIQARYEDHQNSEDASLGSSGAVLQSNDNNIYIRRGRLKVEYQATKSSKFRIYFDGAKDDLKLLEAWIELKKKFGQVETHAKIGQQNVPFGFEIEYSSSKRDFPERSSVERALFPGERDRLVNLTVKPVPALALNVAVLNGPGISDKTFTYKSPLADRKDVIGRVRVEQKKGDVHLSGGVSAYMGKQFDKSDTLNFSTYKRRYGADGQLSAKPFPKLGETSLRAEVMAADEFGMRRLGYYVWLAQRLGDWFGAAIRFDSYDPNTRIEDGSKLNQVSLAGHYYFDENVKLTLAYDIRKNEEVNGIKDKADNILTAQAQYDF